MAKLEAANSADLVARAVRLQLVDVFGAKLPSALPEAASTVGAALRRQQDQLCAAMNRAKALFDQVQISRREFGEMRREVQTTVCAIKQTAKNGHAAAAEGRL
jgi:ABC-type transporter Mla subunit MlaD